MRLLRAAPAGDWLVEEAFGGAGELHAASGGLLEHPAGEVVRRVRVLHAERPAVVLGAGQEDALVDRGRASRLGLEVARRRSGGGAVLVGPGESVWVDLLIPRDDPLWADDVGRAMAWVGALWCRALAALGWGPVEVWPGPMIRTPWSDRVCFAGVGPGEVLAAGGAAGPRRAGPGVGGLGPKVVGVSQRRGRSGALFQTAALLRWRPLDLLGALHLDHAARRQGAAELAGAAAGLGPLPPDAVVAAVTAALPGGGEEGGRGRLP